MILRPQFPPLDPDDEEETIWGIHKLLQNKNGGSYIRGARYDMVMKLRVADAIYNAEHDGNVKRNGELNINQVAFTVGVSWGFANKIFTELQEHNRVLTKKECLEYLRERRLNSGVGARSIDQTDRFVLYSLYLEQPHRSLRSYQEWLFYFTGTWTSRPTICRYLREAYPYRAGLVKPNMVPYDKFRIDNVIKAFEYIHIILTLDPKRLVFADEKLLKGQELFMRKVRVDPMTGEKPAMNPDPDFRNTHSITGFCSIADDKPAVLFRIHEGNNDAEQFSFDVEQAIICGYLVPGDFFVIDNAAYHIGRENAVLDEWLWDNHGIFLLQLPPRSPEWNPIELVWNILVQRLRSCDMLEARTKYGTNASANMAAEILEDISTETVARCFRHCYKFINDL
jgi:hypothetical protein